MIQRILLTPGEPGGIGPDILIAIAQKNWPVELIAVADPQLLLQRAQQLKLPLQLHDYQEAQPKLHRPGTLSILPVSLNANVRPGILNTANAAYVIRTLEIAATLAMQKKVHAIVTGPVNKSVINEAGILFTGHTEFFAHYCQAPHTVMLFVVDALKVALATTHLPLAHVAKKITQENLELTLRVLTQDLKQRFRLNAPRIAVCGLNPHAGENGHLGLEEIEIITPLLEKLRAEGHLLLGPIPADTAFTPAHLQKVDAVLSMYHDQALPLIKHLGFDRAVNVTLGLPFVRTSVDHGTAMDLAGKGKADAGSLQAAIALAIKLI